MARMKPILYESDETSFTSLGIGKLHDAISCVVTETRNGAFECVMEIPVGEKLYAEVREGRLIAAIAHKYDEDPEIFYIYSTVDSTDTMTKLVYARQLAAERMKHTIIGVVPEGTGTAENALNMIKNKIINPVTGALAWQFESDISIVNSWENTIPKSLEDCITESETGILDCYGGELKYSRNKISLLQSRGEDRGVRVRAKRNLASLVMTVDESTAVSGIVPYYAKEKQDGTSVCILATDRVLRVENAETTMDRIIPVDATSFILAPTGASSEWTPNEAQVQEWGEAYLAANYDGKVPVTIEASVVEDPEHPDGREIHLCDIVSLYYEPMGVDVKAKLVQTGYDCIADEWVSLQVGSVRTSLDQTIIDMLNKTKKPEKIYTGGGNSGTENGWTWKIAENGKTAQLTYEQAGSWNCNQSYGGYYITYPAISIDFPSYFQNWTPSAYYVNYRSTDGNMAFTYNASQSTSEVAIYLVSNHQGTNTGVLSGTAVMTKNEG